MIEILQKKISSKNSRDEKIHIVREFLQVYILKIISDKKAFNSIAFLGGTALRILYGIKRYSEGLDFSITRKSSYDFLSLIKDLKYELNKSNLDADFRYKQGIIDSCMISFTNILQSLNINISSDQKLSIKIEIDTNPPNGSIIETTIYNEDFLIPIRHYDLSSLMAGKLHAILFRGFDKGRDFYDLLWYLSKKINPNLKLLNNSVIQTEANAKNFDASNWKKILLLHLNKVDFKKVKIDVKRFLMDPYEVSLLDKKNFISILKSN